MANARKTALDALIKVNIADGYSNIVLDKVLTVSDLSPEDRALASALFYGVIERKLTLDHIISTLANKGTKLSPFIREAVRLGAYQIVFMDKIPDSAAVNETVNIIKKSRESRAAGLVNSLLRRICDKKDGLLSFSDDDEGLALKYSVPVWLIKNISADYGRQNAVDFFEHCQKTPPIYIHTNTLRITPDELCERLNEMGIAAERTLLEHALRLKKPGSIEQNELFQKGYFFAEDLASQLCAKVLGAKEGERILDLCAAPGGKSFATAIRMKNKGELISCDLYESRTGLILSGAMRLGLDIIKPTIGDASRNLPDGRFDRVLCDVPCSGLGIIRRKPDIKYKDPEQLKTLPPLQLSILENGAKAVKLGGRLVYSTCTLRRSENQRIVEKFLKAHPEFEQEQISIEGVESASNDGCLTLMGANDSDGFFVASFKRI